MPTGFRIVGEGDGFLVVNKAPGVDVHSRNATPGLCRLVRSACGFSALWPVHRLDKDTSGLLLMATDRAAAQALGGLFRERRVEKYYVCLADHVPAKKQGVVQGDMVRSRRKSWKLCRSMVNPARTRFLSWSVFPGMRLFVLRPLTGRTHQLRVAMKALGAPILGDSLYHQHVPVWPDRLYLHAHTLRFTLHGKIWSFQCPPDTGTYFQDERVVQCLHGIGPLEALTWPGRF